MRQDLDTILNIRNDFGHKLEFENFNTDSIKERCMSLQHDLLENSQNPRERFINTANVLIVFMNQNATSGMPTAKKFSRKFTELGRLPQIHPIPKDTYETLH